MVSSTNPFRPGPSSQLHAGDAGEAIYRTLKLRMFHVVREKKTVFFSGTGLLCVQFLVARVSSIKYIVCNSAILISHCKQCDISIANLSVLLGFRIKATCWTTNV